MNTREYLPSLDYPFAIMFSIGHSNSCESMISSSGIYPATMVSVLTARDSPVLRNRRNSHIRRAQKFGLLNERHCTLTLAEGPRLLAVNKETDKNFLCSCSYVRHNRTRESFLQMPQLSSLALHLFHANHG